MGKQIEWKQLFLKKKKTNPGDASDLSFKPMLGSYGSIPIANATMYSTASYYPVAEADVALGLPSLQVVSRKLKDIELEVRIVSEPDLILQQWRDAGESRQPAMLVLRGQPLGNYVIVAIAEEVTRAKKGVGFKLRITLKEEGAFLWAGNYSPYNPPPVARKQAEQGMGGLLDALGGWLRR